MTEKKIEALFNDAVVIGDQLERNLQQFERSNTAINRVYTNIDHLTQTIEHISLYSHKIKQKEAQKFSQEIRGQVDRYYAALQEINLDTTAIEEMIERYNSTVMKQVNQLEESAQTISETLHENDDAIVAAAGTLRRSKIGIMWSITMFTAGAATGALFLAAYPISAATKTFSSELKKRDASILALKEQYETNDKTLGFLRKYNITIRHNVTDDSWNRRSLRFAPMVFFPRNKVILTDDIDRYTRIIFRKQKGDQ